MTACFTSSRTLPNWLEQHQHPPNLGHQGPTSPAISSPRPHCSSSHKLTRAQTQPMRPPLFRAALSPHRSLAHGRPIPDRILLLYRHRRRRRSRRTSSAGGSCLGQADPREQRTWAVRREGAWKRSSVRRRQCCRGKGIEETRRSVGREGGSG